VELVSRCSKREVSLTREDETVFVARCGRTHVDQTHRGREYFARFMFLPAGTWAWWKGWLFLLVFLVMLVILGIVRW
jgi:hypothetical protein